jgi:hypothetical protein
MLLPESLTRSCLSLLHAAHHTFLPLQLETLNTPMSLLAFPNALGHRTTVTERIMP